ncbi:type II toxin-antitoxin system VapC family toxin [soil metagenome]
MTDGRLVLDASAMVDLLIGSEPSRGVARRLQDQAVHVPAHFDAEVLSALGRLQRAALLTPEGVHERLERLSSAAFERHLVPPLLTGAWRRRANVRLLDALYLELAEQLDVPLVSTDVRLAAASAQVEVVVADP